MSWLIVYVLLLVASYKTFGLVTLIGMLAWRWHPLAHHYYCLSVSRGEVIDDDELTPYVEGSEDTASLLQLACSYMLPVGVYSMIT